MTSTTTQADAVEIQRGLDLLAVPGGVAEIRGLHVPAGRGKPCVVAGYFSDLDKAAQAAAATAAKPNAPAPSATGNGQFQSRLDVGRWLTDRGLPHHPLKHHRCPLDGVAFPSARVGRPVGSAVAAGLIGHG